ncbi:MAG: hypothetical protein RJQ10_01935 [Haliea sp.]|uniref:HvfA family oxazolone/thioamide-modified RiPP metallophore n=1 Tax=Haliea sp. TaxID=1932666 RepID=UPI0032EFCD98
MAESKKPLAIALGAAFLASSVVPMASAEANPFAAEQLNTGYNLASYNSHGEGDHEGKCGEGKCGEKDGEGKCGEGKCGEKDGEGKCGEGKCGEGKCGEKDGEGKCGEGKCGGA